METDKKKIVLDDYEQELLDASESGKLKPIKTKTDHRAIARNTLKKIKKQSEEKQ